MPKKWKNFCWIHGYYEIMNGGGRGCPKCRANGEMLTAEEMLAELEIEKIAESS